MTSIWVEALHRSFGVALGMLDDAVRDCPDDLWERPMWLVPEPRSDHHFLGPDWKPITDPAERNVLAKAWVARRSTPWSIVWHALEGLDYDLSGEMEPWLPPAPFAGHPHWRDLPSMPRAWSRGEIAEYIGYCRGRVEHVLSNMPDDRASTPLPASHRYAGRPHAEIIVGLVAHTTEHAAQLRQFVASQAP